VLTHNGIFKRVLGTSRRPFSGKLVEVKADGMVPVRMTAGHRVLRNTQYRYGYHSRGTSWHEIRRSEPEWVVAKQLRVGDQVLYTNPKVTDTTRHRRRVWCCSKALAKYFDENFGRKAWNKHFPEEFVTGPLELVEGLLRGLWEGDGSVEPRGFQRARLCTVSPRLAEQVGRMLRRLGYMQFVSVRRSRGMGILLQYHVQLRLDHER